MGQKDKRSKAQNIAKLERAIRKFGDRDGKLKAALAELKGKR